MMPRAERWSRALAALLGVAGTAAAAASGGAPARATANPVATLVRRLEAAGRASVRIERSSADAWTGAVAREKGRLVLEPPDRVALEFTRTGERLTLRSEGGEWLQPPLSQMIVLGEEHAASARRYWRLLMDGAAPGVRAERRGNGRWRIMTENGVGPDSAWLELDAAGLPGRLRIWESTGEVSYRFESWTFDRPRGRSAFVQKAPAGFEVVRAP